MIILGIDPGTTLSAYAKWDPVEQRIIDKGKVPNAELKAIVKGGEFSELAIEKFQCFGMPVGAEVFETAYFIGRLAECSPRPVRMVYRSEIKLHHCRSMKAKDSNIRQAVIDRLGEPGSKKVPGVTYGVSADVWSALAISLFHQDTHELWRVTSGN